MFRIFRKLFSYRYFFTLYTYLLSDRSEIMCKGISSTKKIFFCNLLLKLNYAYAICHSINRFRLLYLHTKGPSNESFYLHIKSDLSRLRSGICFRGHKLIMYAVAKMSRFCACVLVWWRASAAREHGRAGAGRRNQQ